MAKHTINIAGQIINVVTNNVCPPIPVRDMDWSACEAGRDEEGPYGWGASEVDALEDLAWQLDEMYNPIYNEAT